MLNYVNGKIPNNLPSLLKERNLTISDISRITGMARATVAKLVSGDDSYISKMAELCDFLGVSLSDVYGSPKILQSNHAHDNSSPTMIGYQINSGENLALKLRIRDLEELVATQDKLIKMYEKKNTD